MRAGQTPAVEGVGLIGKAPAQPDFVRIDAADMAAPELQKWIEEADDLLRRTSSQFPAEPIRFVFAPAGSRNALIGVMAPSRDQVGRTFPLAVYVAFPAEALAAKAMLVPWATESFCAEAIKLLESAKGFTTAQLAEGLRSLPRPGLSDWHRAAEQRQDALQASFADWLGLLTEVGGSAGAAFAFRTLTVACRERTGEPPKAPLVLACPLGQQSPFLWIELATRMLGWRGQPPSLVWSRSQPPRLLMSLGQSPGAALSFLPRPEASSLNLWPLLSAVPASREAARAALSPEQREALEDPRVSLGTLLGLFAPELVV